MGYNDFYDSDDLSFAWKNTANLAKDSIKLNNYYTQPLCTPTRGAFMTGRYPIRLGLQHQVLQGMTDHGLPLDEVTLADKLKAQGYKNYVPPPRDRTRLLLMAYARAALVGVLARRSVR
jgi:arylsulfatase A-like enzyme